MRQLTNTHRVVGLKRGAKKGTRFQIHQVKKPGVGYATVIKAQSKEGLVVAILGGGSETVVCFSTKQKDVWPDAAKVA